MPTKRDILHELTVEELKANADYYGIKPESRRKADLVEALARSKKCRIREVLADFYRDRLKVLCEVFDLDTKGREKTVLVERLLAPPAGRTEGSSRRAKANPDPRVPPPAISVVSSAPGKAAGSQTANVLKRQRQQAMANADLTWIANYIWGIADDVLRDVYVRGKYRDVILPMTVLRRFDAVLEDSKQAVLDMKATLDQAGVVEQDQALRQAAGHAFYNTSKFTMRDLLSRATSQQLTADFRAYLDGFSPGVQDILDNFEFRNQIPRLSNADSLGTLIEKLTSPAINLSPYPVRHGNGTVKRPGLDNHGMGTVFEELVRRFNEDNNEEAGEHWTPARCREAHGESRVPARRRPDQVRHLRSLRRCLRNGWHAYRGGGDPEATGRRTRQGRRHAPVRAGDQRRNLRHLQGRPAAQGGRRRRRQHRRRFGALDALERRVHRPRVRLHALQSALRQELEDRPRTHGRQERHARPPVRHRAPRRPGILAGYTFQRCPDALSSSTSSRR